MISASKHEESFFLPLFLRFPSRVGVKIEPPSPPIFTRIGGIRNGSSALIFIYTGIQSEGLLIYRRNNRSQAIFLSRTFNFVEIPWLVNRLHAKTSFRGRGRERRRRRRRTGSAPLSLLLIVPGKKPSRFRTTGTVPVSWTGFTRMGSKVDSDRQRNANKGTSVRCDRTFFLLYRGELSSYPRERRPFLP